jgi:hypothetical protein
VLANHANGGGEGGGIFNDGKLTINESAVLGNRADGGSGGGIFNVGALTLNFSAVAGNSADSGADLVNGGTVTNNHSFVGERVDG